MYMILLSFPLFISSLFWWMFNSNIRKIISLLCIIWLSSLISCFYLNGNDWSIYFLSFLDNGTPFSSFEFGFVYLFKSLLFISFDNFGISIFLLYFFCLIFLSLILYRYKCNLPFFFALLILSLGFSLVLEQLRQLIACIIVFYSLLNFSYFKKNYLILVFIASCFHASALVILPIFMLLKIKRDDFFSIASLLSFILIFFGVLISKPVFNSLAGLNFIFAKIAYYLSLSEIEIKLGILNVLDFIFIALYCLRLVGKVNGADNYLLRMIFIGSLIHLLSSSVPLFGRVSYYFYFIIFFYFSNIPFCFSRYVRLNSIYVGCFLSIFIIFNFVSYFRNPIAPIDFLQLDVNMSYLYNGNNELFDLAQQKLISSNQLNATR